MVKRKCYCFGVICFILITIFLCNNIVYADKKDNKDTEEKENTIVIENPTSESSWLYGAETSIYDNEDNPNVANQILDDSEESDTGILEDLLIEFLCAIASWFDKLFKNLHLDITSVVLGRLNGGGIIFNNYRISLFTFELTKGNPYGIVASASYSAIRGIMYIILTCIVFAKIVYSSFIGGSSNAYAVLKESISVYLFSIVFMALMPNVLDMLLYIRDVILHSIAFSLGEDVLQYDMSSIDFVALFKENSTKSFMNAIMYLGSCFLGLWFALQYVTMALTFVIYFFTFPFICMNMVVEKQVMQQWWKNVIALILTPIADTILLFIPLTFGLLGNSLPIQVLQIIICSVLIPARSILRSILGANTTLELQTSGMRALRSVGSFASSAISTAANGVIDTGKTTYEGMRSVNSDKKMSQVFSSIVTGRSKEYTDMYNQENGYGMMGGLDSNVIGFKEVVGRDSYQTGARWLEQKHQLSPGTLAEPGRQSDAISANANSMDGVTSRGGMVGGSMTTSDMDASYIEELADIDNFEEHVFRNISPEKKAELYQKRAKKKALSTAVHAVGSLAGTGVGLAGNIAGASAALGVGAFFSGETKGNLMEQGGRIGGTIGKGLGTVGGVSVAYTTVGVGVGVKKLANPSINKITNAKASEIFSNPELSRLYEQQITNNSIEVEEIEHDGETVGFNYVDRSFTQFDSLKNQESDMISVMEFANRIGNYNAIKSFTYNKDSYANDPEFRSYLNNTYDDIMQNPAFTTVDERFTEMNKRCTSYAMNSFHTNFSNLIGPMDQVQPNDEKEQMMLDIFKKKYQSQLENQEKLYKENLFAKGTLSAMEERFTFK